MKRTVLSLLIAAAAAGTAGADNLIMPVPSHQPSEAQKKQIERKYGMFIHFGINTFHDQEWTDGSKPASSYCPTKIDAEQWVKTAKDAGMKYIILITKHHDGFCLWDSKYTDYDVASSANRTNVVEEVAKACKKHGIGLGLYYSLWDRKVNGDVENQSQDSVYNDYMVKQLNELMDIAQKNNTDIVEFWFDGGWVKQNYRWPVMDIYQTIKSRQPQCQVGINWTIGSPENVDKHPVHPDEQKAGFPIRYFPSDFRLGDPHLPVDDDPKVFTHDGKNYYMPWESTVCLSGRWFYNTTDNEYKSLDELEKLYRQCTKNDNILILNCPPDRNGRIRDTDVKLLKQLRQRLGI
ncbi:MAG TPA: calcium:sodium exchange protein [Porphyromonadaceae bacterium]|nr:alpha-L-fucosidase [Paramuribaculum sp.]HAB41794.1 calcium:sodium exchange protein [Porphyromonadaceae bacterium]